MWGAERMFVLIGKEETRAVKNKTRTEEEIIQFLNKQKQSREIEKKK